MKTSTSSQPHQTVNSNFIRKYHIVLGGDILEGGGHHGNRHLSAKSTDLHSCLLMLELSRPPVY